MRILAADEPVGQDQNIGAVPLRPHIRSWLRSACRRRGISGRDLARASGLSPDTVYRAMAGRPVYPSTQRALACGLSMFPLLRDTAPDYDLP